MRKEISLYRLSSYEKLNKNLSANEDWKRFYEELKKQQEQSKTLDNQLRQKFQEETKILITNLSSKNQSQFEELREQFNKTSQELEASVEQSVREGIQSRENLQQQITQIKTENQPLLNQYWQQQNLQDDQNALKNNPNSAIGALYQAIELQLSVRLETARLFSTGDFKSNDTKQQTEANYAIDAVTMVGGFALGFVPLAGPFVSFTASVLGYIVKEVTNEKYDTLKEQLYQKANEGIGYADISVIAECFARKLTKMCIPNFSLTPITEANAEMLGKMLGKFIYEQFSAGTINLENTSIDDILVDLKQLLVASVNQEIYFLDVRGVAYPIICGTFPVPPLRESNQNSWMRFFCCCSDKSSQQVPSQQQAQPTQQQSTPTQQSPQKDCCLPCIII